MVSPRPVPWTPLTVDVRSREKDSKAWARNPSDMPMPLSRTTVSITQVSGMAPSCSRSSTVMLPPSGVYFMALLTRFRKICE